MANATATSTELLVNWLIYFGLQPEFIGLFVLGGIFLFVTRSNFFK